jgi:hypothetical protein
MARNDDDPQEAERKNAEKKKRQRPSAHPRSSGTGKNPEPGKYELSDDERELVARTLASLGPLTRKEREFLALMLRKPS